LTHDSSYPIFFKSSLSSLLFFSLFIEPLKPEKINIDLFYGFISSYFFLNFIEILISNIKPPIFWKDKSTIIEQSKKWNREKN